MGFLDSIKNLFAGKKTEENQTEEVPQTSEETVEAAPQEEVSEGGETSDENQSE